MSIGKNGNGKRLIGLLLAGVMVLSTISYDGLTQVRADETDAAEAAAEEVSEEELSEEEVLGEEVSEDETAEITASVEETDAEDVQSESDEEAQAAEAVSSEEEDGVSEDVDSEEADENSADAESESEEEEAGVSEQESGEVSVEVSEATMTESYVPDASDLADNDELFEKYLESILYGESGLSLLADYGASYLSGDNLDLYYQLKALAADLAGNGGVATLILTSSEEVEFEASASDASSILTSMLSSGMSALSDQYDLGVILEVLLADCPYELYWYDKTAGASSYISAFVGDGSGGITASGYNSETGLYIWNTTLNYTYTIYLYVSADYQDSSASGDVQIGKNSYAASNFTVDSDKATAAATAAANAQAIVEKYAACSDQEKLAGYMKEICELTSYASASYLYYGDYWQLVYVFDGDSSTNVVCEGYAKAFQYLCDLTDFANDIVCYTVNGTMSGGTGAGSHMWNIVSINGESYLCDLTNSDSGTVGEDGELFLVGNSSGSAEDGYTFKIGSQTITYEYDEDMFVLYSDEILTLASSDYTTSYVASVTIDGVTTQYESLKAAISAARGETATITLLADVTSNETIYIYSGDDITITGDYTISTEKYISNLIYVFGGSLTLDGVTVENLAVNSADTAGKVLYVSTGSVTVTDSTLTAGEKGIYATGGSLTVSGDTVVTASDIAVEIQGTTTTITGGTFTGGEEGLLVTKGTVALSGGTFSGDTAAVETTVSGGTLEDLLADGYLYKQSGSWVTDTSETSLTGTVTVQAVPVVITAQPEDVTIAYGESAKLSVTAQKVGTTKSISYQWYKDGTAISGATSSSYTASGLEIGSYEYYCVVTCDGCSVTSDTATVTVETKDLADAEVTLAEDSYTYDGTKKTPSVTVTLSGTVLTAGTDYTVTYTNNTNAGTATVTVTGTGSYTGSNSATFTIAKAEITDVSATTGSVTAPEALATAQKTVTAGTGYTAEIAWEPADSSYGYNTAYTATLTLTAGSNYIFAETLSGTDGWTVTVSGDTAVLTKTYDATALEPITDVAVPEDTTLAAWCEDEAAAAEGLPDTVTYTTKSGGSVSVDITWSCANYDPDPEAENEFTWTADMDALATYDLETYGVATSGTITVTNAQAIAVTITATDKTVTYTGTTVTITDMFEIDANAGTATYTVTGITGTGTLRSKRLTVTKAGTFEVTVSTEAYDGYAAGSATATLTVNKGTGTGTVTIANWTYGETAAEPTPTSSTNGTKAVTYQYTSTDGSGYNAASAPTDVGSYKVTATFAETDLYEACTAEATFTITACSLADAEITLAESTYTYDGTAKTPAVTVTVDGEALISGIDYTVAYADNTNAGTATVTVTGIGNYSGTTTQTFTIEKAVITDVSVTTESVSTPEANGEVQVEATAGTGYTATLTWEPAEEDAYDYNTVYTAILTLVADENYTFADTEDLDGTDGWTVTTSGDTVTLTKTYDATGKAELTEVSELPEDTTLASWCADADTAAASLPAELTYTTADGDAVTVALTWSCTDYDPTPEAVNTFTWSADTDALEAYDTGALATSGAIAVTNAAAEDVSIKVVSKTTTYDGSTYDVSNLFVIDGNAGTASYKITAGTGEGTLTDSTLTVTKAGTFRITVTTEAYDGYAAGSATATLTVKKGAGIGTVTIESWTYGGTAAEPVVESSTNGTENVTYLYTSEDGSYSSETAPTSVGSYVLTVTFAETDLYEACTAETTFSITKFSIAEAVVTLEEDEYIYDGEEKTPAVTVTLDGEALTEGTDYTVAYTDNTNAGTATVTVTGTGNYTGTVKAEFAIAAIVIEDVSATTESVVAPEAKADVQTTVAAGTGYTAEITWSPEAKGTYGYGTVYTATLTLVAKENYAFADTLNYSDGWTVSVEDGVVTLTYVYEETIHGTLTDVEIPEDVTLETWCADAEEAISQLPKTVTYTIADGDLLEVAVTWSCENYDSAPDAVNPFTWTADADALYAYETGELATSGTITVTNAAAVEVSVEGTDETETYDGSTFDVSDLFAIDENAGTASYEITGGTGEGTLSGSTLTVTKAGTFEIAVTTAAYDGYAAGTAAATLTVEKGAGTGTVTIASWTYGEAAAEPVAASSTNGTDAVTYLYTSTDEGGYNAESAPTDAGSYKVTATFAETDLYEACTAEATFSIEAFPIADAEITLAENTYTYDGTAKTPAVTVTVDGEALISGIDYTVAYSDNTNAGTATVTVTGVGNYSGTETLTFTIEKAVISDVSLTTDSVITPEANGEVQAEAEAETGYTVTLTWEPVEEDAYDYNTIYTATLTLVADENYTFAENLDGTDGWTVEASGETVTLTKTYDATRKEDLTDVSELPTDTTLETWCADVDAAAESLPAQLTYTTEDGDAVIAALTWSCEDYDPTPGAVNTFAWTADADTLAAYDTNALATSGAIAVTNAAAIAVSIEGTDQTVTYDGSTFDVSDLFAIDENAGTASYEITGGTGEGTLTGSTLTVTKAGAFEIAVTTAAYDGYAAGSATATLTVKKGTGTGTVTIEGWTYGETAAEPVAASSTNGTDAVTYLYTSEDGSYSSESAPTDAGSYVLTATFAETDLYEACTATAAFTVSKAAANLTVSAVDAKTYGDEAFALEASYVGDGSVSYESSDESVVTVDVDGTVTIVGAGTTVITVSVSETDSYEADSLELTVTVSKKDGTLMVTDFAYENVTYGDASFSIEGILSEGSDEITYTSSDESVVTVDADGTVTIVGAGTAVITIAMAENDNYTGAETTVSVTVAKKAVSVIAQAQTKTYGDADPELTYTVSGLVDGDALAGITITRESGENVGSYEITIGQDASANPNYEITVTGSTLTIEAKSIEDAVVTLGSLLIANGESQTQEIASVTVTNSAGETIEVTDYEVTGAEASEAGVYTLTIIGTGNFTGTVTEEYIVYEMTVTEDVTVDEATEETIEAAIEKSGTEYQIGQYINVSLSYPNATEDETSDVTVTTTEIAASITITLADSLVNTDETVSRAYYVAYVSSTGEVVFLNTTYDEEAGTLTFEASEYTDYVILYVDTEVTAEDDGTSNGGSSDGTNADDTTAASSETTTEASEATTTSSETTASTGTTTSSETTTASSSDSTGTQTGDSTSLMLWTVGLFAVCAAVVGTVLFRRKRQK